jgi:hypothetical protein
MGHASFVTIVTVSERLMTYMKYDMEYWTFPNIFDHSRSSETNLYVLYVSVFMTIEFQSRVSSGSYTICAFITIVL